MGLFFDSFLRFSVLILFVPTNNIFSQIILDENFGTEGKVVTSFGSANSNMASIDVQSDGKIITCGSYYNGIINQIALSRYNVDGSLDVSFGDNGKVITPIGTKKENESNTVRVFKDGNIIVGATSELNIHSITLVRYDSSGKLDLSFGENGILVSEFNDAVNFSTLEIQSDNKIVVGGSMSISKSGYYSNFILVRYNIDGSKDTSFGEDGLVNINIGTVLNNLTTSDDYLGKIKIQSDGKIIASGMTYVSQSNGNGDFGMIRLNTDGSLDSNFGINGKVITDFGATEEANSIQILSDGKIILSGIYYYNDDANEKIVIAKYNSDGTLDASYGNNGKVVFESETTVFAFTSEIQTDGKLLVSGFIIKASADFFILRFNVDGTVDETFFGDDGLMLIDFGTNEGIYTSIIQQDGKLVLGGNINDGSKNDFILLRFDMATLSKSNFFANSKIKVYPNPFNEFIDIDVDISQNKNISIDLFDISGKKIVSKPKFDYNKNAVRLLINQYVPKGIYFLKISDNRNMSVIKVVR